MIRTIWQTLVLAALVWLGGELAVFRLRASRALRALGGAEPLACLSAATLAGALLCAAPALGQARGPLYAAEVHGPLTAPVIDYLRDALRRAEAAGATALIITLDSRGGVLRAVRPFAAEVAAAKVPVVVYVAPPGTDSGPSGALLLSAAHIAALSPGSSFGSPYPLTRVDAALSQQTRDLVFDSVASQLRGWNDAQGRNTAWVDQAVREGLVLNSEQASALQPPAVDLVAADRAQLITLLEGRTVVLAGGQRAQLATLGREPTPLAPTLGQQLRLALADPTVAFVLLVLGALAIYMEFGAPGTTVFAGIGVVLLIGAGVGLLALPLQWWGLLLVLAGLLLIGAELLVTAHGGFTVAGLALLVAGALNLIDPAQAPGTSVALWAIVLIAMGLAGFAALGVWLAVRSRARPVATGQEGLIGRVAEVRQRLDPEGLVFVDGALWRAICEDGPVEPGDWVRVAAMHNLCLVVRRIEAEREPAAP